MPNPRASDALVPGSSSVLDSLLEGIPQRAPCSRVPHPFAVIPADGPVRLIQAGLHCIRVYYGTPPQRHSRRTLKYDPGNNEDIALKLDELAKQCPEVVMHLAGFADGVPMGFFYFSSLSEAERWLEDHSHTLETLGYFVDTNSSPWRHRFQRLGTSFILYPTPSGDAGSPPRLLEPAQLVTRVSTIPAVVPTAWAEYELFIHASTRSWPNRAPYLT